MFIGLVKSRRGGKLAGAESTLFSGEFWTGSRALELGLVDGLGDLRGFLRERFGEKVAMPLISPERGFFRRRLAAIGAGADLGLDHPDLAESIVSALEARALWARYGL